MQAGVSSRDQYETAHAQRRRSPSRASPPPSSRLAQALANLGGAERGRRPAIPRCMQAQAALDRAQLNVSYGTVVARRRTAS